MGGFFGVVADHDCVCDIFYGTDYHSHLGTKRGGLAVCDPENRITRRIHDITNAQFRSKFDDEIGKFFGNSGIGIISDYEDQPLIISAPTPSSPSGRSTTSTNSPDRRSTADFPTSRNPATANSTPPKSPPC